MAWIVGAIVFALYYFTLCPGAYVGDSGELITAACTLGVAHPPGYPLFVLFGRLAALFPAGSPALNIGILSALFSAVSASLIFSFLRSFFVRRSSALFPAAVAGAVVAGFLAFSRTAWAESVHVEVYALNLFWIALILYLSSRNSRSPLVYFFLGLAATNHQTVLLMLPGLLYLNAARNEFRVSFILSSLAAFCGGLTLYLFLAVRPDSPDLFAWRKPGDAVSFFAHITRAQYGDLSKLPRGFPLIGEQVLFMIRFLVRELTLPALLLPFGFLSAWRAGGSPLFRSITIHFLCASFGLLFLLNHGTGPRDAAIASVYYIPAVLFALLLTAPLFLNLAGRLEEKARRLSAILILLVGFPVLVNFSQCDASGFTLAEATGQAMLDAARPNSIILTEGDNSTFILHYMQIVKGKRCDVTLLDRDMNFFAERFAPGKERAATRKDRDRKIRELVESDETEVYAVMPYTDEPLGGKNLVPVGPLYRFIKIGERPVATDLPRYHPEGFHPESIGNDYMARRYAISYLSRWVDHYGVTGNRERLVEARDLLRAAGGDLRETYLVLAESEAALGDTVLAIEEMERSLSADGGYHYARRELADMLVSMKRYDRAAEEYRRLAEDTGNPGEWLNLGNALLLDGRGEEAGDAYVRALEMEDPDSAVYSGIIKGLNRLALHDEHADALESFRRHQADRFDRFEELGDAHDLAGRLGRALDAYRNGCRRNPKDAVLVYKTGLSLLRLGRADEAEAELRRAVEMEGAVPGAGNALAYLYANSGVRLDEALGLVDESIRLGGPEEIGYFEDTRGLILMKLGRAADAEKAFLRAIDNTPEYDRSALADVYEHIALLCAGRSETDRAERMMRTADSLRSVDE